jgi:hypothetical protein
MNQRSRLDLNPDRLTLNSEPLNGCLYFVQTTAIILSVSGANIRDSETALLTELYRFNPKLYPPLISGSERMDRIKYMATSRGSFSMPL